MTAVRVGRARVTSSIGEYGLETSQLDEGDPGLRRESRKVEEWMLENHIFPPWQGKGLIASQSEVQTC